MNQPILELQQIGKNFGTVIALSGVSFKLMAGQVHCLLGDNGAGKSTLIKILSGVHRPDHGDYLVDGKGVDFASPNQALDNGIATVYQDLALAPLLSVARNFVLGREPLKNRFGFLPVMDLDLAASIAREGMARMGITLRNTEQMVGTMSGGERQCLAIARAVHFGARVLILDEPTAALGVKQSANVLRLVKRAQASGISVILITHNVNHAFPVADHFTLLNRGKSMGSFAKSETSMAELLDMMAGGAEMKRLMADLEGVTI
ncbi:MAG: ATP-binding cassette domain-containing protein [Candidatus Pacebacteria bacterium]|nr:ATP-binding cassette domain-containing protein [Candidatus Paceibacterota bacterium]